MQVLDEHYSIFLRNYHDQELSQNSPFSWITQQFFHSDFLSL